MITFNCPGCGKSFSLNDEFAGRKTKCPKCGTSLRVPTATDLPPSAPVPAPLAKVRSRPPAVLPPPLPVEPLGKDDEDRPPKRRPRDEDDEEYDDRSHRGNQHFVVTPTKSMGISIILTFLFGPLGMLYSTVVGGLIMMGVNFILLLLTICFFPLNLLILCITQPVCIIWGAVATSSYNNKLLRGHRQY